METTLVGELAKQVPGIVALLWLVRIFLIAMREEREACAKSREESRKDFLAELERTHEMYRGK